MENVKKKSWDRKGGRPKKNVKRDEQLAVMCTLLERKRIEYKSSHAGISMSEYLRACGLKGQVAITAKTLPREVLKIIATLNHACAKMNQIAKRCNRGETFNPMEISEIFQAIHELLALVKQVKKYFE